ncbi:MAG: PAS domain-containing sensor histidine kinase [Melioribacteraceae bacterium]|nr:PAS domain-containing sensor histidine kinase [Melioribacteraceae bacterium]
MTINLSSKEDLLKEIENLKTRLHVAEQELKADRSKKLNNAAIEKLKRKEKSLRIAQLNAKVGSWEWDIENDIVEFSDVMSRLLGLDKEKMSFNELINIANKIVFPNDIKIIKDHILKVKKGQYTKAEGRIILSDNEIRWIKLNPPEVLNFNKDNLPSLVIGTIQDITEQKKTVQEKQRLINIIENDKNFVGLLELDGKLKYINKAGLNLIGFDSLEDAIKEFSLNFIGNFENDIKPRLLKNEFIKGDGIINNFKLKNEIQVEYNAFILNLSDEDTAIAVIFWDITDRKRIETALRESRRRFKDLVDLLPIPIFETDLNIKVNFANKAALEYFGYTLSDLVFGIPAYNFVHNEDKKKIIKRAKAILNFKAQGIDEYKMVDINGGISTAIVYAGAVIENEQVVGLRGVIIDISERKNFELQINSQLNEIKEQKNQLAEKSNKLTELNKVLKKSEKELMVLNKNKDIFFSIIAHDLKSPFTSLLGFSEILSEDYYELSDNARKEMIDSLFSSSRSIFNLLEDLLAWARTQSGRIEYRPEYVDLSIISTSVNTLLKEKAEIKQITLINNIAKTCPVFCDFNMINTVVRNLVVNAIKFTPDNGTVSINVETPGEYVKVEIKDTGIGLSKSEIKKLFRIDVNVNQIGKSKEKGTGFGLILCKDLVEKNGGKIWVESELGKGSSFFFTLKRKE